MSSNHRQYNVELITGMTGSGKTTFAARHMFAYVERYGRPVYSNLDLNPGNILRHLARRNPAKFSAMTYGQRRRWVRLFRRIEDHQVEDFWNHVEPECMVVIDEAQVYFPMAKMKGGENPDLTRYMSQHRKLRHELVFITQWDTVLTHNIRKFCHKTWRVQNIRQRAMDLGFFKVALPFDGFFYCARYGMEPNAPVIEQRMVLAALPSNRWLWELFETRRLHGDLARLQVDNGDPEARKMEEIVQGQYSNTGALFRVLGRNKLALFAILVSVIALTRATTTDAGTQGERKSATPAGTVARPDMAKQQDQKPEPTQERVSAMTPNAMYTDRGRYESGDTIGKYVVVAMLDGHAVLHDGNGRRTVRVGELLDTEQDDPKPEGGGDERTASRRSVVEGGAAPEVGQQAGPDAGQLADTPPAHTDDARPSPDAGAGAGG